MTTEAMDAATGAAVAEKAAPLVRVVTATKLTRNGECSFRFMFRGNMPRDWVMNSNTWGFAWLEAKGKDFFHPAAITRRAAGESYDQYVGDDGTPRWRVHLFKSGQGQVLFGGFDDSAGLEGWRTLVRDGSLPPVTILCMERELFDRLEPVLKEEGVTVEAHHFEGELATS